MSGQKIRNVSGVQEFPKIEIIFHCQKFPGSIGSQALQLPSFPVQEAADRSFPFRQEIRFLPTA